MNRRFSALVAAFAVTALCLNVRVFMRTSAEASNDAVDTIEAAELDFARGAAVPPELKVVAAHAGTDVPLQVTGAGEDRAIAVDAPSEGAILYAKVASPSASLEESFSFRYSGPSSVVEPFFVNARVIQRNAVQGFVTDLTPTRPGYNFAGTITYQLIDGSGHEQHIAKGRLRSRPYVYRNGHIYRVDAIADLLTGLLTTRVYDIATGPTTFDTSIKETPESTQLYPGVIMRGNRSMLRDLSFGPYGKLPVREHPARRAADYMNYLGYNEIPSGPATSPKAVAFEHFFPMLLIKHVRVPDEMRFLPVINAVASDGLDADVLTGRITGLDGLRKFVAALKNPPEAIELWNEPNNPSMGNSYDPNYDVDLPPFAAAVAKEYPQVNRWGPSILPDPNGYPSAAIARLRSSVGTRITAWNAHAYTLSQPENLGYGGFIGNACGPSRAEDCGWYGSPTFNDEVSAVINPDLPGVTTEGAGSYGSYGAICGHGNVDLATQQAYVQRAMLYNFKLGHLRIYPYKFLDDGGCSDGFGTYGIISRLIDADQHVTFTPKPAFTSLVYLDHLLADGGPHARDFAAKPLAYAIDGAKADTESLVLAESDGSYRLVLWSDKPLWDFNANGLRRPGSELPLSDTRVTVRYGGAMHATVYRQAPGSGIWSEAGASTGPSTDIEVDQYPLVIAVSPAGAAGASLLPHDVPTPGPIETPRAVK